MTTQQQLKQMNELVKYLQDKNKQLEYELSSFHRTFGAAEKCKAETFSTTLGHSTLTTHIQLK